MGKATSETTTSSMFNNVEVGIDMVAVPEGDITNTPIIEDGELLSIISIDVNNETFRALCLQTCDICCKTFENKESLDNHKITCNLSNLQKSPAKVSETTDIKRCKKCKQLFPSRSSALVHIRECAKTELAAMARSELNPKSIVQRKFNLNSEKTILTTNQKGLTSSSSSVTKKPVNSIYPRKCSACGKTYLNKYSFYHHKKWCNKTEANYAELSRIRNEIHKIRYPRTCTFCGQAFNTKFIFYRHKKQCTKKMPDIDPKIQSSDGNENETSGEEKSSPNKNADQCMGTTTESEVENEAELIVEVELDNNEKNSANNGNMESRFSGGNVSENIFVSHENEGQNTGTTHQSIDDNDKSFGTTEHDYTSDGPSVKEIFGYPRLCIHCQMFYTDELLFEQHKPNCRGFAKYIASKIAYPRKCDVCLKSYNSKNTYSRHKKTCTPECRSEKQLLYPRMCQYCRKIYASASTFHIHKQHCIPVPPVIFTNDQESNHSHPSLCETPVNYPRECENCSGTFKTVETFNAHKIRCDFFEPRIENTNPNVFSQLNCEHCRNILRQYRRIFHQHIKQCDEPVFTFLRENLQEPRSSEPTTKKSSTASTSNETVPNLNLTPTHVRPENAYLCNCCGEFFDSIRKLESHRRSVGSTDNVFGNLMDSVFRPENVNNGIRGADLKCDACLEIFENAENMEEHKQKCLVKLANTLFPRVCECCKKLIKTEQIFYNHKKICHPNCFKNFVQKDCEICSTPFRCEKLFLEHKETCCIRFDNVEIGAECEVTLSV